MKKTLFGLCFALSITAAGLAQTTPSPTPGMATPTRTPTSLSMTTPTRTPTSQMATPTRTTTQPPGMGTPTRTPTAAITVTPVGTPAPGGAPSSADQCKNGRWRNFTNPTFKNQGDCVSFVASQGRSGGNPKGSPTPLP